MCVLVGLVRLSIHSGTTLRRYYMTTQHKRARRCRCGASTHRPFALTLSTLRDLLHYLAPVAKRDFICGRVVEEVETVRGTLSALCGVLLFV